MCENYWMTRRFWGIVLGACVDIGNFETFEALFHVVIKHIISGTVICPGGVATLGGCFGAIENGNGAWVG